MATPPTSSSDQLSGLASVFTMRPRYDKDKEYHEKMLRNVKKEVKQIMEEAVTRKFVHEESSSITSLCAAVEACLSHGLKRRTLGLFKTSSTTALLHKVAKNLEVAMHISKLVQDIENADPNKRSSSSSDSTNKSKPSMPKKPPPGTRYLWIRLALFEKQLAKIIDHLVQNSSKYYEKDALVADPVDGHILASLLVGPCALDYSKMKTQDHFWTDPPADELVQRHRISSSYPSLPSTPPTGRRPGLHFRRGPLNTASSEDYRNLPVSARDYVESLHQNSKATLLYGKNNVLVQPKENVEPLPGYLSLHQVADTLTIKWTPNQLMNGCCAENEAAPENSKEDKRCLPRQRSFFRQTSKPDEAVYWDYALNVNVREIVYVHCHQQAHIGGTVVLVGQDGVQRPPIHFPKGGHLLSFLSCLETGLLPHGQLDPPLWSQRGKGKVFPRLRRKGRNQVARPEGDGDEDEEDETSDYVFRILNHIKPDSITQELMDPKFNPRGISFPWMSRDATPSPSATSGNTFSLSGLGLISGINLRHPSTRSSSSTSSSKSLSLTEESMEGQQRHIATNGHSGTSLQILCDTMKRQIISRAFYGWLAHCRHLRTVRTHLSGLVHTTVVSIEEPSNASRGLTVEVWKAMHTDDKVSDAMEVYRLTYFGGVQHEIRKEVWPYLLGHYQFDSALEERQAHDVAMHHQYENTMSEWLAVEAIVRQRDKEIMAAQLAKLSSESTNGEIPLIGRDHTLSNEVFEDNLSITSDDNQDVEVGDEETGHDEEHETCNGEDETTQLTLKDGAPITNEQMPIPTVSKTPVTPDEGLGDGKYDDDDEELESSKVDNTESEQILIMNPSVDSGNPPEVGDTTENDTLLKADGTTNETKATDGLTIEDIPEGASQGTHSGCLSPVSSNGGVYSVELLDSFALNLHRIDKDVQRCDRNYKYFAEPENLEKLRNVMCTYVWEHLEIGYVQGMCDLVAPLLVIFDDESMTYSCFCELMKRMAANFPHGGAMDSHFANMRSLIQILDSEMFELMHQNGDYTHFYFCYRWFLLDFKRELLYDDVFSIWETIWAARHVASAHIVLFIALALVEFYRDIILNNNMDFTDIIKFFNEMAEHHNATAILKLARELVAQLQTLIDNK